MNPPKLESLKKRAKRELDHRGHRRITWAAPSGEWQTGICASCGAHVLLNRTPAQGEKEISGDALQEQCYG